MELFTKEQLEVLNHSIRKKRIRIEVENLQYEILDRIEGLCSEGSVNLDATSDSRRSCSLTLVVDSRYTGIVEGKYLPQKDSLIWLDKYIKIYVGLDDFNDECQWFDMGLFMIDTPTYTYSSITHSLTFSGMDIMMNYNDQRRGQLTNYITSIPAYTTKTVEVEEGGSVVTKEVEVRTLLRDVFISIIKDFTDIKNYYIAPMGEDIKYLPEDVKFEAGGTVYAMWAKLMEYLPGWEMFFDVDGTFIVQPIPNSKTDTLYYLNPNDVNGETHNIDFSNVKNLVVVRGRTHDNDYFVEQANVSYENETLKFKIDNFKPSDLTNNTTIGFVWLDNMYNPLFNKLEIQYLDTDGTTYISTIYDLYDFEKTQTLVSGILQPDSVNTIRFRKIENYNDTTKEVVVEEYWDYLSDLQSEGYAVDNNINSPYYINGEISGENYYGGMTVCSDHINYTVTLNNKKPLVDTQGVESLNDKTIITFMPNIINRNKPNGEELDKKYTTLTVIDGVTGKTIVDKGRIVIKTTDHYLPPDASPAIEEGKWEGDYTIYKVVYNKEYNIFFYKGRYPALTYYLSGGEYDNIYSNSLAKQRADYELYIHSNLNDALSLSIIPNYTLDVNKRTNYTEKTTGINRDYIIKTISIPLDAKASYMDMTLMVLYD